MPAFLVSVKKGLSEANYAEVKKHLEDQGGQIDKGDVFDRKGIAPGFLVKFPENYVGTLVKGPNVEFVEEDQMVHAR